MFDCSSQYFSVKEIVPKTKKLKTLLVVQQNKNASPSKQRVEREKGKGGHYCASKKC